MTRTTLFGVLSLLPLLLISSPALSQNYTFTTFAGTTGGAGAEDSTGSAARFSSPWAVAVDSAGNVYVADGGSDTIRKVTPAGVVTTHAGLAYDYGFAEGRGGFARFYRVYAIACDAAGNVYVGDWVNSRVRKITPSGFVTTFATGIPMPMGIAVDGSGNLFVASASNHTIEKITSAGVMSRFAGQTGVSGTSDGTGTAAQFNSPTGVAVDGSGNVYVSDHYNHTIRKITSGGAVSTFAGSAGVPGSTNGNGTAAQFYYPDQLTVDGSGNVFVADSANYAIRKVTPTGDVTTFAGTMGWVNSGSADGTGAAAQFDSPRGIGRDAAGNLYVADTGNHTIRKITTGGVVTTLAGSPPLWGSTDATGTAARFRGAEGLVSSGNNIYQVESQNSTIRQITSSGVVTTFSGAAGFSGSTDGTGTAARFGFPRSIARDNTGNLYVADTNNHTIRKITPGGVVTTFAGTPGESGSADGTGAAARFNLPHGIASDGSGNLYVTDYVNSTIRKITSAGVVTTFAGTAGATGTADGTGGNARFYYPWHIASDSSGNLYVTELESHAVRKITPSAVVTTFAGSPTEIGTTDGTGTAARFYYPGALAVDSAGTVFVGDNSCTIRAISPTAVVTTIAGLPNRCGNVDGTAGATQLSPIGLTVDGANNLYVAGSAYVKKGTPALADAATIDAAVGATGVTRQLGTTSQTATNWQWSIIRRPSTSTAQLSSSTIRNPQFTPDVADVYVFKLVASNGTSSSITTVQLSAGTAPVITAAAPVARTAASPGGAAVAIATVSDSEDPAYALSVTAVSVPAGITVSNISNTSGSITATVAASCSATPGANSVTLRVQDSLGLTSTATLTVNVTSNPPPVLGTYSNTTVSQGQSTTVFASAYPSDNGTALLSVSASAGYTGYVSVSSITGEVSIFNPNPGTFTITVLGTDDCNATATRTFTLTVNAVTCSATTITVPATIDGTLSNTDCTSGARGPNYYADFYTFAGTAGSTVTITQTAAFDSYLYLLDPNGNVAMADDDGAGYPNSRIVYTLTASGNWTIHSTSFSSFATGSYQLTVSSSTSSCAAVPITTPAYIEANISPADCTTNPRGASYYADVYSFEGGSTLTIDVSSGTFAPYVYVEDPDGTPRAQATGSGAVRLVTQTTSSNTGPSRIYVTTSTPGATGSYLLRVRNCGATLTPANLEITFGGLVSNCSAGSTCGAGESIAFTTRPLSGFLCDTATYAWNFGDGATMTTGSQVNHTFSAGGTYNVSVTVADGPETAIVSIPVVVGAPAAFTHAFAHLAGSTGGYGSDDGDPGDARFENPFGVYADPAGNVFVADLGTTVRKITPTGSVRTVAGVAQVHGTQDGLGGTAAFAGPRHLAGDASGNIYVADAENHTIRKITPAGVVSTFAGLAGVPGSADGTGTTARFRNPRGLAFDSAGNLYVGDTSNHTVRKITPAGIVSTIAGSPESAGSANGVGASARFNTPYGVAVDPAGNVYVAEYGNHVIRKIAPGGIVTTLAGQPGVGGSANGTGSGATFRFPKAVALDSGGNVFVVDQGNNAIRKITPGGTVTTFAGLPGSSGSADDTGTNARFNFPQGLTIDGSGNLYVADSGNNAVRKVTPGAVVTTITGTPAAYGSVDGTGSAARFYLSTSFFDSVGIASDTSGNVFVVDPENHTVRKITPAGVVTTIAGLAGNSGTADGNGANARFTRPRGIAVDGFGNVYVADTENHTIRRINSSGDVSTLAGQAGFPGFANGTGSAAQFFSPRALCIDKDGNILVADSSNDAIRMMTPGGAVTTVAVSIRYPRSVTSDAAGNTYVGTGVDPTIVKIAPGGGTTVLAGSTRGATDGIGTAARFGTIGGLAADESGNIYVADVSNNAIRKVTPAGVVSSVAGLFNVRGAADGVGGAARFYNPAGIAVGSNGFIYVADAYNNCIRVGRPLLPDQPVATPSIPAVGQTQQLDASPANGTSWQWKLIRRPAGSAATLSSETIRNPQFTPDLKDLYVIRLTTTNGAQMSIRTLALNVTTTQPLITAGGSFTRTAGNAAGSAVNIATVSDAEDSGQALQVTPYSVPEGITVENITNNSGVITATIGATCAATAGARVVTLRVQDSAGATATATLTVNVTANPAPTLGAYPATTMKANESANVAASPAATDNGTVTISTSVSPAGFTGTIQPHASQDGRLAILSPNAGVWTVTVTATDNCGRTATSSFTLTVTTSFAATTGFEATAVGTSLVTLRWPPVGGTNVVYDILRAAGLRDAFTTLVTNYTQSVYNDTSVAPNVTYIYRVIARAPAFNNSAEYNRDTATTVAFTDAPLTAGTFVKAVHLSQLRTAVDLMRVAAGLSAWSYTDPSLQGSRTKAVHVNELRSALAEARLLLGLPTLTYPDTIGVGVTIKAAHIEQIRDGVR